MSLLLSGPPDIYDERHKHWKCIKAMTWPWIFFYSMKKSWSILSYLNEAGTSIGFVMFFFSTYSGWNDFFPSLIYTMLAWVHPRVRVLTVPSNALEPAMKVDSLALRKPVAGESGGDQHVYVMFVLTSAPSVLVVRPLDGGKDLVAINIRRFLQQEPCDE